MNFTAGSKDKVEGIRGRTWASVGADWSRGWGWGGMWGGRDIRTVTEGSLTIDVVDQHHKELLWSGTAKGRVTPRDENNPQPAIDKAVSAIFTRYPRQPLVAEGRQQLSLRSAARDGCGPRQNADAHKRSIRTAAMMCMLGLLAGCGALEPQVRRSAGSQSGRLVEAQPTGERGSGRDDHGDRRERDEAHASLARTRYDDDPDAPPPPGYGAPGWGWPAIG